ncbi:DUF1566 domain-containing protein [Candidatus Nomurabacteria bacterium]|nr:DUF1566 domain-containing protein [Candidatus Nomurabacteria bacterium]
MKSKFFILVIILVLIFFSLTPFSQASTDCVLTVTLKQSMKGEQVQCLQQKLNITADGKFGKNTKTSVITFQTSNNLKGDGIVGKLTRDLLNKKEIKQPCTQGELFNTITGKSCTPNTISIPRTQTFQRGGGIHITTYSLSYTAGTGGSITGIASQRINSGNNGSAVTATPDTGYVFDIWSDGVLTATRTDTNVTNDKSITATFIPTIATAAIAGVTAPVTGATPTATIADTTEYTATISWNTNPVTFASNTIYTATITITPKTGYTLSGVPANFFTVAGATATNSADSGVVSAVFPVTDTTINTAAIAGVTPPVTGATPVTTVTAGTGYTGTVTWSGSPVTFASNTIYTATITITPTAGYTLTGVTANQFTIAGATSATNPINSGVITAVFPETVLAVGVSYQGGIIAYILQSGDLGYVSGETHGLIAATADQGSIIRWNNGSDITTNATGTVIGTGLTNTDTIITSQGAVTTSYAAGVARAYTGGGYSDWYLPSRDELSKLYLNRMAIGGFLNYFYWSSSEINNSSAHVRFFFDGTDGGGGKVSQYLVRAVRSF